MSDGRAGFRYDQCITIYTKQRLPYMDEQKLLPEQLPNHKGRSLEVGQDQYEWHQQYFKIYYIQELRLK